MTTPITTWSLEQTSPADLSPARLPKSATGGELVITRAGVPSPEFSRFFYGAVGGGHEWTDRLVWTDEQWRAYVEKPGVETWVAYLRGTPAGYIELEAQADGVVEIAYFGLLAAFQGQGIGGHLLSEGTARAWDLATRWEGREATRRVWVHTCTKDGPHALANYEKRGFRVFTVKTDEE
ncbi:GNAT family N-acetyltransferase [Streptomyces sp. NPDC051940]|uniref:GNAT family N-acetyltransferase n=1 Tax=Streptomyces sp. NPDC051940 TaxID=3155675 RepID=UPI00343FB481